MNEVRTHALVALSGLSPPPNAECAARPDHRTFSVGVGAAAGFGRVGGSGQVRWAGDWSIVASTPAVTPASRSTTDGFTCFKHVALGDQGDVCSCFPGEVRLRYIFENHPLTGTVGNTDSSLVLLRSQYGADLHFGRYVRIYTQSREIHAVGSDYYGSEVGTRRDLPNIQPTWDDIRNYAIWACARTDPFDFVQTDKLPTDVLSNDMNCAARVFGVYSSATLPAFTSMGKLEQICADVFHFGYSSSSPLAAQPIATPDRAEAGSTRRDDVGTRFRGRACPFRMNLTGVLQGSQFRTATEHLATRPVRAYAVTAALIHDAAYTPGKPGAGVKAGLFSGGSYRTQGGAVATLATSCFLLSYHNGVKLVADLSPVRPFHMKVRVLFFWHDSTNDAVYGTGKTDVWRDTLSGGFTGAIPQAQACEISHCTGCGHRTMLVFWNRASCTARGPAMVFSSCKP